MVSSVSGASAPFAASLQGLQNAASRANQAAENIAQNSANVTEITQDIVELSIAENAFAANATVLRELAESEEKVIDILA